MDINDRIKHLRKDVLKLTQEQFADAIHITRSNLSVIEIGKSSVTDRNVFEICKVFNVNEEWLKNGHGDMFIKLSRDEEIARYLGNLLKNDGENREFQRRFVRALSKLSESDWQMIQRFAEELAKKD